MHSHAPPAAGTIPPRTPARVLGSSGLARANEMRFDRTRPLLRPAAARSSPRARSSPAREISATRALQDPGRGFGPAGRASQSPLSRGVGGGSLPSLPGLLRQGYLARRSRCIHHIPCAPSSREAGGEAGAPAWWLRVYAGDCVPGLAATAAYEGAPTSAATAHLQRTPPPLCAAAA